MIRKAHLRDKDTLLEIAYSCLKEPHELYPLNRVLALHVELVFMYFFISC